MDSILDQLEYLFDAYYAFSKTSHFYGKSKYLYLLTDAIEEPSSYIGKPVDLPEIPQVDSGVKPIEPKYFIRKNRVTISSNKDAVRLAFILLSKFTTNLGGEYIVSTNRREIAVDTDSDILLSFLEPLVRFFSTFDYTNLTETHGIPLIDNGNVMNKLYDDYDELLGLKEKTLSIPAYKFPEDPDEISKLFDANPIFGRIKRNLLIAAYDDIEYPRLQLFEGAGLNMVIFAVMDSILDWIQLIHSDRLS